MDPSHLNGFHVFPRDNIRITSTVMNYSVLEQLDTLHLHSWYGRFCIKMANNSGVVFSLLFSILYDFLVTVKAASHEFVIRTGQP